MRYLSVFLPDLPTDRLRRSRNNIAPDAPFATIAKIKSTQRLVAVDALARQIGLKPGMTLAEARAMHPFLVVAASDPAAEARTLAGIADWCRRFTPLAALDAPDGAMLDVTGAVHLFGDEDALLVDVERRLAAQGFVAQAAIASTPEAAWAAARYGRLRRVPANLDDTALARLFGAAPLAALRLDSTQLPRLRQAGLRSIGDVVMRPRAPLAARFGKALFARLDALLGRSKSAITPRFEAPAYMAERRFAEGLARREDIEAMILALAGDLAALLRRHGEGARLVDLTLFRVDGAVRRVETGTSRPLRDPVALTRLFREKLDAIGQDELDTGYGFDVLRLAALRVERLDEDQQGFTEDRAGAYDVSDLIDRLGARFGLRRVTRLVAVDTHLPEFAVAPVPAARIRKATPLCHPGAPQANPGPRGRSDNLGILMPGRPWVPGSRCASPGMTESRSSKAAPMTAEALVERPIRLLQKPEPIEAVALLPDGPPRQFRWRRVLHEVVALEGPERIAPEWWRGEGLTRDYFRAEVRDGQRFWLYREGVFERETVRPRWFLHGLFA